MKLLDVPNHAYGSYFVNGKHSVAHIMKNHKKKSNFYAQKLKSHLALEAIRYTQCHVTFAQLCVQ
jgi:hypothetical protein